MRLVSDVKDIKGVTVFNNIQEAQHAREKALIAEAKWKKTLAFGIADMLVCWILMLLSKATGNVSFFNYGVIVSYLVYIYCEVYYGKLKWINVFRSFLSGTGGVFILIWIIEIIIFFSVVLILANYAACYGLGIILLMVDRHYYQMTINATEECGFDDSQAQMKADEIKQKNREDSEKWKKTAFDTASKAKETARAGAEAINKKMSESSDRTRSTYDSGSGQNYGSSSSTAQSSQKTWYCPSCGNKNTGKFCSQCGTPKPERDAES